MAKPIYAGSYQKRGRGRVRTVFTIIVLLHVIGIGTYLLLNKNKDDSVQETISEPAVSAPAGLATPPILPEVADVAAPGLSALQQDQLSNARATYEAGQLAETKIALDRIVADSDDAEAIELLSKTNMKLLKSALMMPGKQYYVIQSGDYLQKIAKKFNTTVALIKQMNGLKTNTIQRGSRLLVFNGNFHIRVSKSRNELDLMLGDQLFKRYSVGTGKFGKTPVARFTIIDKIEEPPWTRPSDNKQVEYGDPENVLGTRWMAIKSADRPELTGFGIHGTWERDSVGKQSSAGCIRMLNEDVEELFDIVPRKTTVNITE